MKSVIRFIGAILLLIITLLVLNHLSGILQKDTLRRYRSIEELKGVLNDVSIPSYFPEFLSWPPSKIMAGKKPYRVMVLEFKDKKRNTALVIIESEREDFRTSSLLLTEVIETLPHRIKDRKALLKVGRCKGHTCSELTWKEGRYYIKITLNSGPFEIMKIAESMVSY